MSSNRPSLDDLIRAQRSGVGMTAAQRAANGARLTSRLLEDSMSAANIGSAASSAAVGRAGGASAWLAKFTLGIVLVGGAGAAYVHSNRPAQVNLVRQQEHTAAPLAAEPVAVSVPAESANPAPPAASSVVQMTAVHQFKQSTSPGSPNATASLAVEVQLMHDVDSALKSGHPERALALLDELREGDKKYLREERAAARVFALCQLGRVESARAEAARFLRDRPRSPLAARVKSTCAGVEAGGDAPEKLP